LQFVAQSNRNFADYKLSQVVSALAKHVDVPAEHIRLSISGFN